ncbi:MAG: hypothetical protein K2K82_02965 [Muribaculaceae bacterium]|nr:hypothetical protein [Muribaculaceae bacterium]
MKIKVFAHHRDFFRWRTLIQVGDDWSIRGTVFMKNPGSSSPTINPITETELSNLNKIDNTAGWFNFTVDPTMNAIVNLFRKRDEYKGNTFEGIIQIFNITNVMSPNVGEAVRMFQSTSDPLKSTWEDDIKHIVPPIYIGWGDFYRHHLVKHIGSSILTTIQAKEDIKYLADAGFIHPLYLMVYGANKQKCIAIRESFFKTPFQ